MAPQNLKPYAQALALLSVAIFLQACGTNSTARLAESPPLLASRAQFQTDCPQPLTQVEGVEPHHLAQALRRAADGYQACRNFGEALLNQVERRTGSLKNE